MQNAEAIADAAAVAGQGWACSLDFSLAFDHLHPGVIAALMAQTMQRKSMESK